MEPERLSQRSQETAIDPCPEPVESSPQLYTLFILTSIKIFPSIRRTPKWPIKFMFPNEISTYVIP
jgi:hypothetical protein